MIPTFFFRLAYNRSGQSNSRCKFACRTIATWGFRPCLGLTGSHSRETIQGRSAMSVDHSYPNLARKSETGVRPADLHASSAIAILAGRELLPNSGIPLDLNWLQEVRVNTSAVERRVQSQVARRTAKKEWQAAWLLRAITCLGLTPR